MFGLGAAGPRQDSDSPTPPGRFPWDYFLLVTLLLVPFLLLGGSKLPLPVNLPASALATFAPALAAVLVAYRHQRGAGVKQLLSRALDHRKIKPKAWYIPLLLLAPLIYSVSYVLMRLAGRPLPAPRLSLLAIVAYLLLYAVADTGEELGWSGHALDPLQARWGALRAALFMGLVWSLWHLGPWIQTGNTAGWIAWQAVKSVAMRVVIVWLYNRAGKSVLAATLYHATDNTSWSVFPNDGSHYDPMVVGLLTMAAAILLTWRWPWRAKAR